MYIWLINEIVIEIFNYEILRSDINLLLILIGKLIYKIKICFKE